jgi:hypothetical protein
VDSEEYGGQFADGEASAFLQCAVSGFLVLHGCGDMMLILLGRVHDNSTRYVAEENVEVLGVVQQSDIDAFPIMVGKFFKRWDGERNVFVSNVKDEYPDD